MGWNIRLSVANCIESTNNYESYVKLCIHTKQTPRVVAYPLPCCTIMVSSEQLVAMRKVKNVGIHFLEYTNRTNVNLCTPTIRTVWAISFD